MNEKIIEFPPVENGDIKDGIILCLERLAEDCTKAGLEFSAFMILSAALSLSSGCDQKLTS